tara:strand:- start:29862 stop:29996 length:135 start_codon:yes stop_codon:yes gene_type:complete
VFVGVSVLLFEIIAASFNKSSSTGNSKFNNEDIPEVKAYFENFR